MGIISACQISCRSLPANVSVIGKAGSTACLTAALAWASRVATCLRGSGCYATGHLTRYLIKAAMTLISTGAVRQTFEALLIIKKTLMTFRLKFF